MRKRITVRGQLGGLEFKKLREVRPQFLYRYKRREKKNPFPFQGEQLVLFSGCAAF